MRFSAPLLPGRLQRRYKRFLADIRLDDGREVTAHCANPGSMLGLDAPGNRVWLLPKTGGKLGHSLEIVEADFGAGPESVGINTQTPNRLAAEAILAGRIGPLAGYASLRREVAYGRNSRVDFLLDDPARGSCHVEVKNVHLCRTPGLVEFPDCVTVRGAKHLGELARLAAAGHRAVMLFVIQMRAERFALAADLDPAYATAFAAARAAGVEAIAVCCRVTPEEIEIRHEVPIAP